MLAICLSTFSPTLLTWFYIKISNLVCGVFVHNNSYVATKNSFLNVQVRVVISYEYMIVANK